jgi:hypothetical protein
MAATPARKIAALDIATTCGHAVGCLGEIPRAGSIRFGIIARDPPEQVFATALEWAVAFFERERPDILILEAMLPPAAMLNKTSRQVRDRLAGLHGIMLGCGRRSGVGEFVTVSVGDIRRHFIGDGSLKRNAAKRETIRRCVALGWPAEDDNAADACAIWSYACALLDPRWGLRLTPLFNRAVAL